MQSQTAPFDLDLYIDFLEQNKDMTTDQLLEMFPAGIFKDSIMSSFEQALYADSIDMKYSLTGQEKELIMRNGFVVTERLQGHSFIQQFHDIWVKDMPVFISADAILHTVHASYDAILKETETNYLIEHVTGLLKKMHEALPELASEYSSESRMDRMLRDVDVYLTIPLKLLGEEVVPVYSENSAEIDTLLNMISAEQFDIYPLFSENCRLIDFSQFKPRGHYVNDDPWSGDERLEGYFRAMMWLGRTEIYLIAPESLPVECPPQSKQDIQRQVIDAVLMHELMGKAEVFSQYSSIEEVISFFVGEQDNVTVTDLGELILSTETVKASQLLDTMVLNEFQDSLRNKSYAWQQILSQLLRHDDLTGDSLSPASAFMLFGQRFVIDSYVTGNVVYDRIKFKDEFPCRLFPSTLDILFSLGNDASTQLLVDELDAYNYSSNLSGLRYLIDSYGEEFWKSSLYNLWLRSIRTLNPAPARDTLPLFMQSAAWWQEKMNTQLASWTELRHDNLLYAKQSYSAMAICSYPYSYVEPVPEFYQSLQQYAEIAKQKFNDLPNSSRIIKYFEHLLTVSQRLHNIALKELDGTALSDDEKDFLKLMLTDVVNCVPTYGGWYPRLYYNSLMMGGMGEKDLQESNYLVADYHTTPTDCGGNLFGWVSHAGTGPVDMLVMAGRLPDDKYVAFIGPVASYFEYRTTDFLRLTDQEWNNTYLSSSMRPEWTNFYLADNSGNIKAEGITLRKSSSYNASLIIPYQVFTVYEHSTLGTIVGTILSGSIYEGKNLTYAITGGDPDNIFAINSSTREIYLNTEESLDYEAHARYDITVEVRYTDEPGSVTEKTTVTIYVLDIDETSVHEINNNRKIKLHPNPANDILYLEIQTRYDKEPEIEILSLTGSVIYRQHGYTDQIDLSGCPAGVYFVKISLDEELFVKKIVKQ